MFQIVQFNFIKLLKHSFSLTLRKTHLFLFVSIIFIISCQPSPVVKNPLKDPNNLSCKNENWVWIELIDGDSGWFELNEPILPNGRHSFFYSNGKIRKTIVIPFGKVGDSIVYHDTSGTVISIKSIDSSYQVCERFLDGDFKYFSPQCGLLVDGIIEGELSPLEKVEPLDQTMKGSKGGRRPTP